jgi:L-threonylcarbamoyladenylate synthase
VEDLESIMNQKLGMPFGESRASGMLASHYAPKCTVVLAENIAEASALHDSTPNSRILDHWDNYPLYAASLYSQMRQADSDGVSTIIAVLPLKTGLGYAIGDRLSKASFL